MKSLFMKTTVSLLGAAMVSTALVGCGGGGSGSVPPSTSVNVTGGIAPAVKTSNSNYDASAGPVSATLSDGAKITLVGGKFAPGDKILVIPAGSSLLKNLFLDDGRAQGDVLVSLGKPGVNSSSYAATLTNPTGSTAASTVTDIGLPVNQDYTITFVGPFVLSRVRLNFTSRTSWSTSPASSTPPRIPL